jgi:hypothetical protein
LDVIAADEQEKKLLGYKSEPKATDKEENRNKIQNFKCKKRSILRTTAVPSALHTCPVVIPNTLCLAQLH